MVRAGGSGRFIANGLVHIILGATAAGLALGKSGEAEQSGAMQQMASQPFGMVLLWLCMLGCALLALWNLANAFFGTATLRGHGSNDPRDEHGRERWKDFVLAIAQGITYAAVAVLFGKFVFGQGSDSGQSSQQASSTLAQAPAESSSSSSSAWSSRSSASCSASTASAGTGRTMCARRVRARWRSC